MPSQSNNPYQPETAKQLDRDLHRMDQVNAMFRDRSDGWTWRNVVAFDFDASECDRPWILYVGDESTYYDTLQAAIDDAADSLRDAAACLDIVTELVK